MENVLSNFDHIFFPEKNAFVASPALMQLLQQQGGGGAPPGGAPPGGMPGGAPVDPSQMAVDPAAAQGMPVDPTAAAVTDPSAAGAPTAAPPPTDPAQAAPPTNVGDPGVGQPVTMDGIRQLFTEMMAQQGGAKPGGGSKSKGGGNDEIMKNMATDAFHTKQMMKKLLETLEIQHDNVDPNRHPETGLPVSAEEGAAQATPPTVPAKSANNEVSSIGRGVKRSPNAKSTVDHLNTVMREIFKG